MPCLCLPLTSTKSTTSTPAWLLCGCWDLSSSPHAGKPSASSHKPSPQPTIYYAYVWLHELLGLMYVSSHMHLHGSGMCIRDSRHGKFSMHSWALMCLWQGGNFTKISQASPALVWETDEQMATRTLCFRSYICSQFLCEGFISIYYSGRQPSATTLLTISLDRGQVARIFSGQFQQMFINTLREANSRQISNIGGGDESHRSSWKQES